MFRVSRVSALICMMAVVVSIATACRHKAPVASPPPAPPPTQAVPPPPPAPPPPVRPPAPPAPLTEDQIFARKSIADLNAEAPLGDALFAYDQSTIGDDARAVLSRNATWLARWPSTTVTVEGHCDERGTPEYNLALGERRAAAVKVYLVSLGIAPDRMTVVSYGKERPACTESSEPCWQRNRRGHATITGK